jgi:phosphoribosylformimino-5-aminoimidazole carboxamide ribotide isomerase
MDVVPVIDVRHGVAVAAIRGDRASYGPLATPLAEGSDPVAIALGYARLFTFPILYIADLDGIEGRGRNAGLIGALAAALPGVRLWVDDGARPVEAGRRIAAQSARLPVVGTESMEGETDIDALRSLPRDGYVLSLDFRREGFIGPPVVLQEPLYWPRDIIVMTLARVGAGEGPDLERVKDIVARAQGRRVYAAGGVRDRADVEALHQAGAAGVLVASALHAGKVKAGDLREIAGL